MGHGTSKGFIDNQFQQRVDQLEDKAKNFSEHFRNHNTYREWHVPRELTDPLDVPSLHVPAWERNDINKVYAEDIIGKYGDNSGTGGDALAMKWQADYMAIEERAFRTRHASAARCAAMAHGRLDAHGRRGKSLFSFLVDGVDNALKAGSKTGSGAPTNAIA